MELVTLRNSAAVMVAAFVKIAAHLELKVSAAALASSLAPLTAITPLVLYTATLAKHTGSRLQLVVRNPAAILSQDLQVSSQDQLPPS